MTKLIGEYQYGFKRKFAIIRIEKVFCIRPQKFKYYYVVFNLVLYKYTRRMPVLPKRDR